MCFDHNLHRRQVCITLGTALSGAVFPGSRFAHANGSPPLRRCGELHPSDDERDAVEKVIEKELRGSGSLKGHEAAAIRVHHLWGRWNPNRIVEDKPLRVAFMQADHPVNAVVVRAAAEWERHMRLRFEFVGIYADQDNPGDLDILVNQDAAGNSSYLGIASRYYAQNGLPSLNLQKFDHRHTDKQIMGVALHELGHALGLIHEHQNPEAKLNFDKLQVEKYYKEIYGWDEGQIERNIFFQYEFNGIHLVDFRTEFDTDSIMMYELPGILLEGEHSGFSENYILSEMDKRLIYFIY